MRTKDADNSVAATRHLAVNPRQDPVVQRLLAKMPPKVADSFSTAQLHGVRLALMGRSQRQHDIDIRSRLALPFTAYRLYLVFLVGRDNRELSGTERRLAGIALMTGLAAFVVGMFALVFISAYLLKSALGINLFEGFSLGLWDWFKGLF